MREFPKAVQRNAGYQIELVQAGGEPTDWKPMKRVGPSVREIRIRDTTGAFRVLYVATYPEAVYVLHAFQKKSNATDRRDLDLATLRLRLLK